MAEWQHEGLKNVRLFIIYAIEEEYNFVIILVHLLCLSTLCALLRFRTPFGVCEASSM